MRKLILCAAGTALALPLAACEPASNPPAPEPTETYAPDPIDPRGECDDLAPGVECQ